eukprot:5140744-Prorocentrum_lima.AAC.1
MPHMFTPGSHVAPASTWPRMIPPQTPASHQSSGTYEAVSETTVGQMTPRDIIRPALCTNKGASSPGS